MSEASFNNLRAKYPVKIGYVEKSGYPHTFDGYVEGADPSTVSSRRPAKEIKTRIIILLLRKPTLSEASFNNLRVKYPVKIGYVENSGYPHTFDGCVDCRGADSTVVRSRRRPKKRRRGSATKQTNSTTATRFLPLRAWPQNKSHF